ncbi:DinB family protein [Brevibacillus sp. TJ4]|uniref:DinB family protein n=1 Tax=Brevibacillus sp. TJ4 TaxID=3234853 RepID=UPI0037CEE7CB
MSSAILHSAQAVRSILLKRIKDVPEELFDVQPEGFNNTIRWNLGHIVVSLDFFFSIGASFSTNLPESYPGLFKTGTKPDQWEAAPPSKEELVHYLSLQLDKIKEMDPAALDVKLQNPVEMASIRMETTAELVNFGVIHETMHVTTISNYVKLLKNKRQQ